MLGRYALVLSAAAGALGSPLEKRIISLPFDQLPSILRPTAVDSATHAYLPVETEQPDPPFTFPGVIKLGGPLALDPPADLPLSFPFWRLLDNVTSITEALNVTQWLRGDNATTLTSIVPLPFPPNATRAINVTFAPTSLQGLSFLAQPLDLTNATRLALSYSLLVQEDFDWATGGVLPGLYGGSETCLLGVDCFSALPSIFPNGTFSMNITAPPCAMAPCSVGYANATFTIPTGRWTTVRLEVNTESVGMSDGYALLYVDGSLAASIEGVKWRREGNPASGVKTRSLPGAKRQVIDAVDPERWSGMWHEIGVMGVIARERSVWLTGHEIEVLA